MSDTYSNNISQIRDKIDRIGRNKEKIGKIIIREGWVNEEEHSEEQLNEFIQSMYIKRISFEAEKDGFTALFVLSDGMGYLGKGLAISMLADNSVEIEGWDS
ncbi:MAG: hypothetical protein IJ446_06020 [Oscillospiraceae bacterium]|nr:hypothetical protein [Oscillospiraceae bacterium]